MENLKQVQILAPNDTIHTHIIVDNQIGFSVDANGDATGKEVSIPISDTMCLLNGAMCPILSVTPVQVKPFELDIDAIYKDDE